MGGSVRGVGVLLCAWLCGGCGSQVRLVEPALSELGESCEARSDCAAGLVCIELVCREDAAQGGADAGPDGLSGAVRSAAGESCARGADCAAGLACVQRRCVPIGSDGGVGGLLDGPIRSARGESCVASNDCGPGLACVQSVCRTRALAVPHLARECHRVECVEEDDCCKDFVPQNVALCQELQTSCAAGVRTDCNLYASLCDCIQVCEDSVCVARVACANDTDCGGSGVLRCIAGRCAQCGSDQDCTGTAACVSGLCRGGCDVNEQCPLFSVCDAHRCEPRGCQSDRECFFTSGNPLSRCVEAECLTPCESDSQCSSPFEACVTGYCGFVGCEDDEECRAALQLADQPTSAVERAVCRAPL